MYLPGDLMISKALLNDMLGRVPGPRTALELAGSRPARHPTVRRRHPRRVA